MDNQIKKILLILFTCIGGSSYAQNLGLEFSLDVTINETQKGCEISWSGDFNNQTTVYRKLAKAKDWNYLATVSSSDFTDSTVQFGLLYEYKLEMDNSATSEANYNVAYGYATADLRESIDFKRQSILVLVDSALYTQLIAELLQLKSDYELDGFDAIIEPVSPNDGPKEVKTTIVNNYYQSDIAYVYIIGHIAVPYSGFQAPDGHNDHMGAWPADGFYADINTENWTEHPFFAMDNTRDPRNSNGPNDGKYDQAVFPTPLELNVARIDFSNLPVFEKSELELTKEYLNRASNRKHSLLNDNGLALIEDSLMHENDGFGNNFYRNFSSILEDQRMVEGDYLIDLSQENYLIGMGASYANDTSAFDLATSREVASIPTNAMIKLLSGSYFGDWDTENNFLRSNLASGNTLNVIWTGRPNYFLHPLAANKTIGECFKLTCNNGAASSPLYEPRGSSVNSTSMNLFGDPTLRLAYTPTIEIASISEIDSSIKISWLLKEGIEAKETYISEYNTATDRYEVIAKVQGNYSNYTKHVQKAGLYQYIINVVYEQDAFQTPYLSHAFGTKVAIDARLHPKIPDPPKPIRYPENLRLNVVSTQGLINQITTQFTAKDSGEYRVVLEIKSEETENRWMSVEQQFFLKENRTTSPYKAYFVHTMSLNVPIEYRATCSFLDTILISNDTMLSVVEEPIISIYPNPCELGEIHITGSGIRQQDLYLLNSEGKEQFVLYDAENQILNVEGFRKGLYFIKVRETWFKVAVLK